MEIAWIIEVYKTKTVENAQFEIIFSWMEPTEI